MGFQDWRTIENLERFRRGFLRRGTRVELIPHNVGFRYSGDPPRSVSVPVVAGVVEQTSVVPSSEDPWLWIGQSSYRHFQDHQTVETGYQSVQIKLTRTGRTLTDGSDRFGPFAGVVSRGETGWAPFQSVFGNPFWGSVLWPIPVLLERAEEIEFQFWWDKNPRGGLTRACGSVALYGFLVRTYPA
jgi:hypothetical protein